MKESNFLIFDNISVLEQAVESLDAISNSTYNRIADNFFHSSIGAHFRHVIEHYTEFFSGLTSARINYDARKRLVEIEKDKNCAFQQVQSIIEKLYQLEGNYGFDHPVSVYNCSSVERENICYIPSTISRELLFLHSHLVHHFALIDIMLKFFKINYQSKLGIAPSTQKYLETIPTDSVAS